jgi:hypothetical protein
LIATKTGQIIKGILPKYPNVLSVVRADMIVGCL